MSDSFDQGPPGGPNLPDPPGGPAPGPGGADRHDVPIVVPLGEADGVGARRVLVVGAGALVALVLIVGALVIRSSGGDGDDAGAVAAASSDEVETDGPAGTIQLEGSEVDRAAEEDPEGTAPPAEDPGAPPPEDTLPDPAAPGATLPDGTPDPAGAYTGGGTSSGGGSTGGGGIVVPGGGGAGGGGGGGGGPVLPNPPTVSISASVAPSGDYNHPAILTAAINAASNAPATCELIVNGSPRASGGCGGLSAEVPYYSPIEVFVRATNAGGASESNRIGLNTGEPPKLTGVKVGANRYGPAGLNATEYILRNQPGTGPGTSMNIALTHSFTTVTVLCQRVGSDGRYWNHVVVESLQYAGQRGWLPVPQLWTPPMGDEYSLNPALTTHCPPGV